MDREEMLLGVQLLGDCTQDVVFELQIFAEGGGDGAGSNPSGPSGQLPYKGSQGAQAADGQTAGAQADDGQAEEDKARRAAFEEVLAANKDLYEERLKAQLDRRMRSSQRDMDLLKGQNARFNGLAQAIAQRYGINANDMDGLEKAIREDQSWIEEQAAKNGLTVEQQRHMNELEAKNREFEAARAAAERQAQKDATLAKWQTEADALKQTYEDFDLDTEVANPDFARLLGSGVAMQTAYEVVHHDELISGAMKYAVNRTANAVAANVRANGLRPTEGAGRGGAPSSMNLDVHKLSKEQRADIVRRVERGERITLR